VKAISKIVGLNTGNVVIVTVEYNSWIILVLTDLVPGLQLGLAMTVAHTLVLTDLVLQPVPKHVGQNVKKVKPEQSHVVLENVKVLSLGVVNLTALGEIGVIAAVMVILVGIVGHAQMGVVQEKGYVRQIKHKVVESVEHKHVKAIVNGDLV